jgi:hypothetical protein
MSIKERIAKLINVKSLITLALTVVFCILAATGVISSTAFLSIFTTVIGFYFGTQTEKRNGQKTNEVDNNE